MKRFSLILSIIIATFFIGCDNSLVEPDNTLNYNGNTIQDIEAPFLSDVPAIASIQFDEIIPEGIVYGTVNSPENVYLAQGSEVMPSGIWVDNLNNFPLIYNIGF